MDQNQGGFAQWKLQTLGVCAYLPARRKEIDKPAAGIRLLGIPTVLDRIIQQTNAQIVEQIWD